MGSCPHTREQNETEHNTASGVDFYVDDVAKPCQTPLYPIQFSFLS